MAGDDGYRIDVWPEYTEELQRKLDALADDDPDCFMALMTEVRKITGDDQKPGVGVNRSDRIETLDGKIDTYEYRLWGCTRGEKFLMTREIGTNTYLILDLTREKRSVQRLFELACQAHGLVDPVRQANED